LKKKIEKKEKEKKLLEKIGKIEGKSAKSENRTKSEK